MRPELDKLLCEKYPKIFKDRYSTNLKSSMSWGFSHGDGWYNIIDQLCSNIQHHIDSKQKQHDLDIKYNKMIEEAFAGNLEPLEMYFGGNWLNADEKMKKALDAGTREVTPEVPQVVAAQVKEKFGTLRFYYDGGDDLIDGMVRMAEGMSSVTCEYCGNPGKTNKRGWIRTICEHCEEKRNENSTSQ